MLLNIETFFGRFHPLMVHLPIGFLLLAVFFALLSLKEKFKALYVAVPVSLLVGSISAAFACITGYVLSLSGDYDTEILDDHLWAGIFTTIISFLAYFISIKKIPLRLFRSTKTLVVSIIIIFICINVTGHLGGSLTHGADYISTAVLWDSKKEKKKITDVNQAFVFADLVQPILEAKCGNCHNSSKKKGKLSVANFETLIKGGKHGAAIKPGDVAGSQIIKRVSLNSTDKKFMPADGKTPLTAGETAIIKWWIEKAASETDKKLLTANAPDEIKKFAAAYVGMDGSGNPDGYAAISITAPPVRKEVIEKLKANGFAIKFLNYKPDLLDITLPAGIASQNISERLKALLPLKENIIWLNIADNNVSDNEMGTINQFKNMERLRLDKNPITDKGIANLVQLKNLKSLNLYKTRVTKNCFSSLLKLTALEKVFVWNTSIRPEEINSFKSSFHIVNGYNVQ